MSQACAYGGKQPTVVTALLMRDQLLASLRSAGTGMTCTMVDDRHATSQQTQRMTMTTMNDDERVTDDSAVDDVEDDE
jgi:hypothetical protein